jgi:arabinofuranan 3-O-arabinosyltransferase
VRRPLLLLHTRTLVAPGPEGVLVAAVYSGPAMRIPHPRTPSAWAAVGVYLVLLMSVMVEKVGQTTNDTKTPLIESPSRFLEGSLSLWNPQVSLGELQNQAYGYLFPQGPFYLLADLANVPPWVSERLWSWLILVAGCEGARRLAGAMAMSPWAAWVAGMAYGLNPRVISQVGTRTGEILPMAALPWVALPIVLALTGRIGVRRAALFSAAAYLFTGALNATATVAVLPLVFILIAWGVRRRLAPARLLAWWTGLIVVTSLWWATSLLTLRVFSPPFFDYVEDADVTTRTTGYTSSLRGASNWIIYNATGGYPTWPAGFDLAYEPWLVAASGILAAFGVLGLVTWRSAWRAPLVGSVLLGITCLVVGHQATLGSPLSQFVRDLLDGDWDLFRNVSKIDPILRLPLCVGVGAGFARVAGALAGAAQAEPRTRAGRARTVMARLGAGAVVALVLVMAQPAVALNLRTPGWSEIPDHWHQAADYLEAQGPSTRAWVIPGAGFGVQTWGWTMDEPIASVTDVPWVTRSQVPLAPPETIRVLSRLEEFLASGTGSPNLGAMLARLGITDVVVRHDLDPTLAEATAINLVSIAMARSEGVTREESFGRADLGPAIEVFSVDDAVGPALSVVPEASAVTVAGAAADVVDAVGSGLVAPDQVAIVQGDDDWSAPADVVGDSYRSRMRNFGRVHDAEGPVLAPDEPTHSTRVVPNYPGNTGSRPVVSRYTGIDYVDASSSAGFTNGFGQVRPENAPYFAVDGDRSSAWRTGFLDDPVGQWLDVRLDGARDLGEIEVLSTVASPVVGEVRRWRIDAAGQTRSIEVDPFTGLGIADFSGVVADRVRLTVTEINAARGLASIAVQDVSIAGLPAERTLVVPPTETTDDPAYVFTAAPEVRACITTLLGPDCNDGRARGSEESMGIDRTFEVATTQQVRLTGTVLARPRMATHRLLDPLGGEVVARASSALASDPTVSARMAYDGSGSSSWIAEPFDPNPTLTVDFATPRTISRLGVIKPAAPGVAPTLAVLRSGDQTRSVSIGDFGIFEPMRVKRLTIEFSNPTRGLAPIGVGDLVMGPEPMTLPLDGAGETGAICGFGPQVRLDGKTYDTAVDGFIGNVVSAGPLDLALCDDQGIAIGDLTLTPGTHRLQVLSTEEFQPVVVALASQDRTGAVGAAEAPTLTVSLDEPSRQEGAVGPGEASILRTTRNFNAGWVAELDGVQLAPQRVDGWAQGWRIPAGDGGVLVIRYDPERSYLIALFSGLAVAMALLVLAFALMARTSLRPGVQPQVPTPLRRRSRVAGVLLVATAPAWLLGGVPAAAGLALTAVGVLVGHRGPALAVAAALLVAGPVAVALSLHLGERPDPPVADLLSGAGLLLALGTMLVSGRIRRTGGPSAT